MGLRGPKPQLPDGLHITRKGYLRGNFNDRMRLAHTVEWERVNGPIPPGWHLHHVNEDKQDNRIENLALVDPTTHKRIHGGCELRDGAWWKPCRLCGEVKRIDGEQWYLSAEGWPLYGRCRACHIRVVVRSKQERRARVA